ncbi:MAG: hypothetical protein HC831_31990 [Chloroflexia bacterium]|nr:hypothetical protein [Chloroflexia bacterium]
MKKLTTYTFLAMFSLAITLNASAQESNQTSKVDESNVTTTANHRINIKVNSDNLVVFRADLSEGQKRLHYVLNVYAENGDMVYGSTFIRKRPIYKPFDLSKLPEGKYTFQVSEKMKPIYSKTILNKANSSSNDVPLLVEEK